MSKRTSLTFDDGMMVWKARDAYRAQTVLLTLFYVPQFLFVLFAISHLSQGRWSQAAVYGLAIAGLWGARWVLYTGLPWAVRGAWRALRGRTGMVGLLLVGLLGLSGCGEMIVHGNRLMSGVDCRPEAMHNGQCAITRGAQK